jgi:hypothetical protein
MPRVSKEPRVCFHHRFHAADGGGVGVMHERDSHRHRVAQALLN